MAAKPIERFIKKQIAEQGGWPRILERYASGEAISKLAQTFLRPDTGLPITRQFLYRLIGQVPGLLQQFQALKPQCAAAVFEKGLAAADDMPADRDAVLRDKAKADIYFRGAALIDREQFGDSRVGVNVTVNVASLHVDALRHRIVEASRPLAGLLEADEGSAAGNEQARQHARGTVSTHSQAAVEVTVEPQSSAA